MTDSGLPPATTTEKSIKFGNIVIKNEKPTQTFEDAKKGLDNLERAAKEKVFTENDTPE